MVQKLGAGQQRNDSHYNPSNEGGLVTPTTISTLEAIRLFLFLKQTAFVIAADSQVIRHAVKKHFGDTEDRTLVTSYFDKLIQVPIQVPPLGTQEVRAYLILLHVYRFVDKPEIREKVRCAVCEQLSRSWEGRRIDQDFLERFKDNLPSEATARIQEATRLAHLLTTATDIAGNPRLIKRFLNALFIRQAVAKAQGIVIDPQVLAKILLLERCGGSAPYKRLVSEITGSNTGKPEFLKDAEERILEGNDIVDLPEEWKTDFIKEWLALPPQLSDIDLRKELYVSRESAAIIFPQDRLSSEAAALLAALMDHPGEARSVVDELKALPRNEISIIFDKLIDVASRESEWGTPAILDPLMALTEADPAQGSRLSDFLRGRRASQVTPALVKRISDCDWAAPVLSHWQQDSDISNTVKKAIGSGTVPPVKTAK